MKFLGTSALLLVTVVLVAGQRDFSRNFDGSSSRFLNGDATGGSDGSFGDLSQGFTQDFTGQSASYRPSYTDYSNLDGESSSLHHHYNGNSFNKNYGNDKDRASASHRAHDSSNSRSTGFRGLGSNLSYDSKISSNKNKFSGSSRLSAGFGSSAFDRNHNNNFGFGPSSLDTVSHIPLFPLASAFNSGYNQGTKASLSGAYPDGNGFSLFGPRSSTSRSSDGDYSASGSSIKARGSPENNGNFARNGFYHFGGSHNADSSSSSSSSNNRNDGFSGSGFRRNRLADQNNSANYGLTGSSTGISSSDSKSSGSSLAQGNQANSGSGDTKIVGTTTTTTGSGNGDSNRGDSSGDSSSSNATGSSNLANSASESSVKAGSSSSSSSGFSGSTLRGNRLAGQNNSANYGLTGSSDLVNSASGSSLKSRGSSENNGNSLSNDFYGFGGSHNANSSSSSSSSSGFSGSTLRGNPSAGQNNSANYGLTGSSTGISSSDSKSSGSSLAQGNLASSGSGDTKIVGTTTATTESGNSNLGNSGNDYSSFTATTSSPYYQGRGSSFGGSSGTGGFGGFGANSASSSASSSAGLDGAFSTSSSRAKAPLVSANLSVN